MQGSNAARSCAMVSASPAASPSQGKSTRARRVTGLTQADERRACYDAALEAAAHIDNRQEKLFASPPSRTTRW